MNMYILCDNTCHLQDAVNSEAVCYFAAFNRVFAMRVRMAGIPVRFHVGSMDDQVLGSYIALEEGDPGYLDNSQGFSNDRGLLVLIYQRINQKQRIRFAIRGILRTARNVNKWLGGEIIFLTTSGCILNRWVPTVQVSVSVVVVP